MSELPTVTTLFVGRRNQKVPGKQFLFRTGCLTTMISILSFRSKSGKLIRQRTIPKIFSLSFLTTHFSGLCFFCKTLLKLIFKMELSLTCLDLRKKFWIKQRTFPKTSRTSPEESTGFTSIAILSQENFQTLEVTFCFLCQLPRFRSVTPSPKNQGEFHGIL